VQPLSNHHPSTFAKPLALSFTQSGMTMIATTIFKFPPFAVIGKLYGLARLASSRAGRSVNPASGYDRSSTALTLRGSNQPIAAGQSWVTAGR
jgi:hypothetical protein